MFERWYVINADDEVIKTFVIAADKTRIEKLGILGRKMEFFFGKNKYFLKVEKRKE